MVVYIYIVYKLVDVVAAVEYIENNSITFRGLFNNECILVKQLKEILTKSIWTMNNWNTMCPLL